MVRAAGEYGCNTQAKVLSADELDGRESFEPTADAVAALDWVWEQIVSGGHGRWQGPSPTSLLPQNHEWRHGRSRFPSGWCAYINEDLARGASVELRQTNLEDGPAPDRYQGRTHDLQDWAFKFAVRVAMAMEPVIHAER